MNVKSVWAITKKEFLIEFRDRNPFFSMLSYVFGIALICYFGLVLKTSRVNGITWNALFWINLFFIAQISIGKSFFGESKYRNYYYALVAKPLDVIIAKIVYNILILSVLSLSSFLIFSLIFNQKIGNIPVFIGNLFAGSVSLSVGISFLAALASKANNNATLLAVLSIPVMTPLLLFLIRISNNAIDDLDTSILLQDFLTLGAINVILIIISFILFPYLWRS